MIGNHDREGTPPIYHSLVYGLNQVDDAYNKMTFNNQNCCFISTENGMSVLSTLEIYPSRTSCMACHVLDSYCENF